MYYEDTQLVKRIRKIIKRYMKRSFVIDLLWMLPLFLISHGLLLFKLIRLVKFRTYLSRISTFIERIFTNVFNSRVEVINNTKKIVKFMTILFLTIHILACIWSYMGVKESNGWIQLTEGLLPNGENLLGEPNDSEIYLAAIYWVITTFTTIGYGDIKGSNNTEYLFSCLIMLIGVGFFSYIIGNISSIIVQDDSITELKDLHQKNINLWLIKLNKSNKDKTMSSDYFFHSNKYFLNAWDKDHFDLRENEIFLSLKPRLQSKVADLVFMNVYDMFHLFFRDLEVGFRREVVYNMKFESYHRFSPYTERYKDDRKSFPTAQRNFMFSSGTIPDKVYFIVSGEAYASNNTGRFIYFKLLKGSYFGVSHLLAGIAWSYSLCYDEMKGATCFTVEGEKFLQIWRKYPDSLALLVKRSRLRRIVLRQYKFEALKDIIGLAMSKGKLFLKFHC